ncbi:Phospholipid-transporting ATPase DNF1, partial [Neolecta irregularis DAH-3]
PLPPLPPQIRTVAFNAPLPQHCLDDDGTPAADYPRNKIRTAKYTPLTFVPKNLWFQFHNVANIYFLFIVILQIFPIFGASNPGLGALPLIVIVTVTAFKDAIEDWRRMLLDIELNNTRTYILHYWHNVNVTDENISLWRRAKKATTRLIRWLIKKKKGRDPYSLDRTSTLQSHFSDLGPRHSISYNMVPLSGSTLNTDPSQKIKTKSVIDPNRQPSHMAKFKPDHWKSVRVGDFILLRNNDQIPADVVVLSTSDADGACFVETKNLDGETNLKVRHALRCSQGIRTAADCELATFIIESEGPSPNLYSYNGVAKWKENDPSFPDGIDQMEPITIESMLLRGSSLRNTEWVIGVVLFTGTETKIMMNSGDTPSKRSKISTELNWNVIVNFMILFCMCFVSGIVEGVTWSKGTGSQGFFEFGSTTGNSALDGFVTFWTCIILFQNLVPISLYISIEIIKTLQAFFIYSDIDMYYEPLDYPCTPKSWNISDDLGQIEYIFSDKTGTLTQNVMEFKKCTVNGVPYGEAYTEAMAGMQKRKGIDVVKEAALAVERIAHAREEMLCLLDKLYQNPWFDESALTFISRQFVSDLLGEGSPEQQNANRDFILALALCHSVLTERVSDHPTRIAFHAQSPDEAALVATARDLGVSLIERTKDGVVLDVLGQTIKVEVLNQLEFNSSRKRMSVIVRLPDGKIMLYCKGADSIIYSRLVPGQQQELRVKTAADLVEFAQEGLRTLCIAKRELSEQEYSSWCEDYEKAASSLADREGELENVSNAIERELYLMGGTAIEDKLQDGVPDAIQHLLDGGIKLWVLTGDKVETAINIGFACNLLGNEMNLIMLQIDPDDGIEQANAMVLKYLDEYFNMKGTPQELEEAKNNHSPPAPTHALVIDGDALKLVLDKDVESKFLLLCKQCKAVLCCRVSPSQKASVVNMVKHGLDVMTLSIGDGANDVAMIQQANVGVGIVGEEGRQAVMSADYAIGQFRFLSKLILVHGRWSYRRIAETVANFFYKNMVWTFTLFWFQIYNQFDGSFLFDYTYILLYNLAFTSVPVIVMGVLDQDVSAKISMKVPQLYRRGILRLEWTQKKFWKVLAVYLLLIFQGYTWQMAFISHSSAGFATMSGRQVNSAEEIGVYVGCIAVFVVNAYVMLNQQRWDWLFILLNFLSSFLIFIFTGFYSLYPGNHAFYHTASHIFTTIDFWAVFVLSLVTCLLPRFTAKYLQKVYYPFDSDIIREQVWLGKLNENSSQNMSMEEVNRTHDVYLNSARMSDHSKDDHTFVSSRAANHTHSKADSKNSAIVPDNGTFASSQTYQTEDGPLHNNASSEALHL